jgi:hypothetical protein
MLRHIHPWCCNPRQEISTARMVYYGCHNWLVAWGSLVVDIAMTSQAFSNNSVTLTAPSGF